MGVTDTRKKTNLYIYESILDSFEDVFRTEWRGTKKGVGHNAALVLFLALGSEQRRRLLLLLDDAQLSGTEGSVLAVALKRISEAGGLAAFIAGSPAASESAASRAAVAADEAVAEARAKDARRGVAAGAGKTQAARGPGVA